MQPQISAAEPDSDPLSSRSPPRRLGRWHRCERLGSGGTAEAWRAEDATGREAAIKTLKPPYRDAHNVARLRAEHAALVLHRHPRIVQPIELLDGADGPALVLDYLPGGDLVPVLGGRPRDWLPAVRDLVAAVSYLHARGVAHGDVQPRNALFAADGTLRLIDLASLRPVDAAALRGGATRAYLPAALGTAGAAERFAVAALLFELATGALPYGRAGQASPGEAPRLPKVDGPARIVATAATEALVAGDVGLSTLADVIESALAA